MCERTLALERVVVRNGRDRGTYLRVVHPSTEAAWQLGALLPFRWLYQISKNSFPVEVVL